MATVPSYANSDPLPTRRNLALDSAEEQASILRAALSRKPDGTSLELEPGFVLEDWERALLYREARFSRDPRGEALTLLHARAAEWAVTRALGAPDGMDAREAEAAALLLDRALADIGTAGEVVAPSHEGGLESIAERLHRLYDQVTATSLRLASGRGTGLELASWFIELTGDEFEVEDQRAAAARLARPVLRLAAAPVPDEPDAFEIEGLDALFATAATPHTVEPPGPGEPAAAPAPEDEMAGVDELFTAAEMPEAAADPVLDAPSLPVAVASADEAPLGAPSAVTPVAAALASATPAAPQPSLRPATPAAVKPGPAAAGKGLWLGLAAAASVLVAVAAVFLLR